MGNNRAHRKHIADPRGGANQTRVRAHNERLVLSLVRRHGQLAKTDIAARSGLSAQTVSVIMRSLEQEGFLLRGNPKRGKVGQPSVPMSLNPEGAYSLGLKVGRRSAELILVNFLGEECGSLSSSYKFPEPIAILNFADAGITKLCEGLTANQINRIAGIGVSIPFELWNWAEKVGVPQSEMNGWRHVDFRAELESLCNLPSFLQNDATSACGAELVFGIGPQLTDFAYFFIGTFIGGGIVLNHTLYPGRTGNAGAFGPMPIAGASGKTTPLIDHASIYALESMLTKRGIDPSPIWLNPDNWDAFGSTLDDWIATTAKHLAMAIVSTCAIIDFEAAVIDGGFPANVRHKIVNQIKAELKTLDLRGISEPKILEGQVGSGARALGGASLPLFNRFLLDDSVLFKDT